MKHVTNVEGRPCGIINLGGETVEGETKPITKTDTKLNRIAELSRGDSTMEFKWLMPHINKESLISCYHELDGKKAVGIDGVTKEQYGENLEGNIDKLICRMKTMSYRPQAAREVLIPKDGKPGATRPLAISAFEDKVVQLQVSKILEAIYEPIFRNCSYGFRPGRNCHLAVKDLFNHLWKGSDTVIDVDLKNYFGTIQHETLLNFLRIKIKDERFIRYIARMLKAGIFKEGNFVVSEEGSGQGNIASPILSNIYAHYVLDTWLEDVVPAHTIKEVKSFRYADDQVICCKNSNDAMRVLKALKGRLNKYGLELNADKTKVVKFNKWDFPKVKHQTFDYLGFTFYIRKSRKGYAHIAVKTSYKRLCSKLGKVKQWCKTNRHKGKLRALWDIFNAKIRGHIQYYGVTFNTRCVSKFVYQATRIFFKWINRRSQRKSMTWEQFQKFQKAFPQPKVKIRHALF
ncbi:MAG: group II intron reverse transcriptase/maturase [Gammaproteobacteria bacterium]|nr:group II intron reverse transcriptase/maturase [Gammaproteobacteria bacterium]